MSAKLKGKKERYIYKQGMKKNMKTFGKRLAKHFHFEFSYTICTGMYDY
jgi:hypothetical protein